MWRRAPIGSAVNSHEPDELLPARKFVTRLLNGGRRGVQHHSGGPNREAFTGNAAALQDVLLVPVQLLEIFVEQL